MNILFVTDLCPISDNEFGLPLTLLNFIQDFKMSGNSVVLFRPNVIPNVLMRGRKLLPPGEYFYKEIRCINKNYLTPFFHSSQFEFLKKENFDFIVSHMPSGILAANKISKLLKIPYSVSVHSSDLEVLKNPAYSILWHSIKKAYMKSKVVLPRSFWLKEKIEKIIPQLKNKTYVIPSGIEACHMLNISQIPEKAEKMNILPLKIFAAGSLIKRKNFENLIRAAAEIEDVELHIAGEGRERESLIKLVKKLKCEKKIIFEGRKTREEILNLMEEFPVFILPSYGETFGMVYIEALSKGCITVCTENSGVDGIIKDDINGFLTRPDKNDIIKTINKIKNLKNPEIIMKNALDTAISLERTKMAQNYLNIIQNILV